jgi:hypothetical protein
MPGIFQIAFLVAGFVPSILACCGVAFFSHIAGGMASVAAITIYAAGAF